MCIVDDGREYLVGGIEALCLLGESPFAAEVDAAGFDLKCLARVVFAACDAEAGVYSMAPKICPAFSSSLPCALATPLNPGQISLVVNAPVLILPGYGNSGPEHWQSIWEQKNVGFERLEAHDWLQPVCAEWVSALEARVRELGPDTLLVAHSLGCLQVAHWAARTRARVRGALLVAPPDPQGPEFPKGAQGFEPVPMGRFGFASVVVASSNDPYGDAEFAERCARAWGSRFVNIGACGHINASSNLCEWAEGFEIFQSLARAS